MKQEPYQIKIPELPLVTMIVVPPDITPEENEKRWKELEQTLSNILKAKVTLKGWK